MLRNLFRVAIRNFKKDKGYTLLNILGLTMGISFSLLLIFYVLDELSYDRYHKNADRIYRIVSYVNEPENHMKWAGTQVPLGPELKKDYPEVEYSTRIVYTQRAMYKKGDSKSYEEKFFYADSAMFKIFTYEFLEGNPNKALDEPKSIVLTRSIAEKYFGRNKSVLGKSFENDHGDVYKVTGVIKDVPKHSHIIFNALISMTTLPPDFGNNWGSFGNFTYVLLKPNTDPQAFEKKLLVLYEKRMAPIFAQYNIKIHYGVQPLTSIHLHSDFTGEPEELGSMSYIYIFSAVALFMLIIACINYMNLTTARSARRAKEIGIRKVTGSTQGQLIAQFLLESVILTVAALMLSLGVIYLALPVFNGLAGKFISLGSLINPQTLLILFLIVLFVGLAGGSYPAFYLSKFNPVAVLKGSLAKGSSNTTLRRILVVTQFSISMTMLICTWVVYGQLKYLRTKDLGFTKEQVLTVPIDLPGNNSSKVLAFKNQVKQISQAKAVSTANTVPGGNNLNFNLFSIEGKNGYTQKGIDCYEIDEDYLPTLGIKIVKGRNFTGATDTTHSIIVNEEMVREFGWDEPIGKKVKFPGDTSDAYLEVVGVMKDFHQKSLYNPIAPLLLLYRANTYNVQIRLGAANIPAAIGAVETAWKANFQDAPFQYKFLDQDFDSQYSADKKRGKIFIGFSAFTIIITCLGLLGLIAFTTEQRQKEISIRKVMGASLSGLVTLIIRNFVFLVIISSFIAFPVAWYFMHKWLELFPYKEGMKPVTFFLSAIVVLLIAVLTVSFHTIKVALANPVNALRTE